uniref:Alpha-hemolysin translocation ATP-binding protein HlyB n=1 Tax=Sym plasmid TaxID=28430 RepID=A0A515HIE5_9ZZZZ|nr:Alpha-hemolysin translocation ATP-binding protein HlyB [Sym plasmid]
MRARVSRDAGSPPLSPPHRHLRHQLRLRHRGVGGGVQPATARPGYVTAPVMNEAASEARKLTAAATSSGSPYRPSGMTLVKAAITSGEEPAVIGFFTGPGAMQLTVALSPAASRAVVRVKPIGAKSASSQLHGRLLRIPAFSSSMRRRVRWATKVRRSSKGTWRRSAAGRTVFIIAHRLSAVRHANRIIMMENGNIAESARSSGSQD